MADFPDASQLPPEVMNHNDGPIIIGVCAAMIVLSIWVAPLRFWSRRRQQLPWLMDDWLILISVPFLWSVPILGIMSVKNAGVGRHLAANLAEDPDRFGLSFFYLFIGEITYGTVLSTIKISILLMYYRIFPTRFMKIGGFVLGAMAIAWWIAVVIVTIFQCQPVHKMWHPFMEDGSCLVLTDFFLGNAIPNIITDMLILALPVFEVRRLQLPRVKKIAVGSIFLMGGAVVVISCYRLKAIFDIIAAGDDTDFTRPCWIWTSVEPTVALICASMPTMQPLLKVLFGRFFDSPNPSWDDNDGIVTIGGSGSKHPSNDNSKSSSKNRTSKGDRDSIFKRIQRTGTGIEGESDEDPVLRPEVGLERDVRIAGGKPSSVGEEEGIQMNTIKVHKDMVWTETRPAQAPHPN